MLHVFVARFSLFERPLNIEHYNGSLQKSSLLSDLLVSQ